MNIIQMIKECKTEAEVNKLWDKVCAFLDIPNPSSEAAADQMESKNIEIFDSFMRQMRDLTRDDDDIENLQGLGSANKTFNKIARRRNLRKI